MKNAARTGSIHRQLAQRCLPAPGVRTVTHTWSRDMTMTMTCLKHYKLVALSYKISNHASEPWTIRDAGCNNLIPTKTVIVLNHCSESSCTKLLFKVSHASAIKAPSSQPWSSGSYWPDCYNLVPPHSYKAVIHVDCRVTVPRLKQELGADGRQLGCRQLM